MSVLHKVLKDLILLWKLCVLISTVQVLVKAKKDQHVICTKYLLKFQNLENMSSR